tara:strand:+ start:446 stop:1816 length:1371 start_codon:yes stop_codon:yes gene_type:complete
MGLFDKRKRENLVDFKYQGEGIRKIGGTNTTENGTFKTFQKNNTDKKTSFDEKLVDTQYYKLDSDDDQLIKKKPGDRYRGTKVDGGLYRGGAALNVERNVEDTARITKFLTTPKGLLFTGKQILLQKSNASEHTRGYKIQSPITNRPPFVEDERHIGFKSHEAANFIKRVFIESEGSDNVLNNRLQVEPVTLKSRGDKPRGTLTIGSVNTNLQSEQRKNKFDINNVKRGNHLNPLLTDKYKDLPKDFIEFRVKDAVNNQFIQFPAYLTDITDNSSAEYNPTRYIGRPDQVFVYSGYTRSISFGFRVAALQKEDVPILWRKIERLKLLTLPTFSKNVISNDNELRPVAPFVELTLGNLFFNTPGYFGSVNVTIPQTSTWELDDGYQLPHVCDVSVEFTYVGKGTPQNMNLSHNHKTSRRDGRLDDPKTPKGVHTNPEGGHSLDGHGYNIGTVKPKPN